MSNLPTQFSYLLYMYDYTTKMFHILNILLYEYLLIYFGKYG